MKETLIIACSPRAKGNTDTLADWAAECAREKGFSPEIVYLRKIKFSSCIACGACSQDGACHVKDGLQELYPKLLAAEKIILIAPIFFQSLGGLTKAMIDRLQCFWSKQYLLHESVITDEALKEKRKLYGLLCGATNMPDTFLCSEKLLKITGLMLEAPYAGGTFFPGIDDKGDIEKDPRFQETVLRNLDKFFGMD